MNNSQPESSRINLQAPATPFTGLVPENFHELAHNNQFGVYVHVPYCRVRCGYCDFNTYTATELKGTTQLQYADEAVKEIAMAKQQLSAAGVAVTGVETVFFGGGTPTLLPTNDLQKMLQAIKTTWGLKEGAEINIEANPDSVTEDSIQQLAEAGFTRVSIGMQSAVKNVLATLDRTHLPENVGNAVSWVKNAGMQVSVDLIYGTPGETLADWKKSLETAISYDPDHISAYALIVEEGTKLARDIRKGNIEAPSDDLQAEMYELADDMLKTAGFEWYELSNWSRSKNHVSRHNLAYWNNTNWWGVGPGAHSHIGGLRWWNVKHPAAYAQRIAAQQSPFQETEIVDVEAQNLEMIMLKTRLREGLPIKDIKWDTKNAVASLIANELIDGMSALQGKIVPTLKGRLLADVIVHALTVDS